jgi:hypothetical protein
MNWSETNAALKSAGLSEAVAFNATVYLTRDGRLPTAEEVAEHVARLKMPRKRRPTDGLRLLTTPDEDFGSRR